ncbi:hypothetical protein B0H13DRAFT_2306161 [Mycena leptocephala]|nr:hypothetical protein B0H13DRAFT_2306161 [Mycena leptocephala]
MPQTSPQSVPHVGPANSSIYSMPGKDEEHPCGELIPSRLICRGSKVWYHAGLEYQVHNCGYFRWLAPELVAAAERRVQDGPAGGAPPFPPQDYPHDPWANSPPLAHSGTMALDPALAALSTAPQSTQLRRSSSASSFPPPTQLTQSGKPKCAVGPCQRIAGSQHCTHRMCKQCCEQQQKGCAYTGHRKNQVIISMSSSFSTAESGDPSTLSRPTPMHSYKYPAASMEVPPPSHSPKLHKKPMDPEWALRYNSIPTGAGRVAENFATVVGIPFPSGTWYQQQRAWKYSSQEERDRAARLPRTADGVYTVWRDTSSGWARILNEKKRA